MVSNCRRTLSGLKSSEAEPIRVFRTCEVRSENPADDLDEASPGLRHSLAPLEHEVQVVPQAVDARQRAMLAEVILGRDEVHVYPGELPEEVGPARLVNIPLGQDLIERLVQLVPDPLLLPPEVVLERLGFFITGLGVVQGAWRTSRRTW